MSPATFGLNGVPLPAGREWSVDVGDVPDVSGMLAAAARARAAGAEVVVASLHCCLEYDHDPTDAQVAAVRALLASPDVDLVLGHHAHVVQPFEQIAGEWAAYGLGNHVAEHATRGYPTEDSVMARFTFTRGDDGRFTVTAAEAVPLSIVLGAGPGHGASRPTRPPSSGSPPCSTGGAPSRRGSASFPADRIGRTRLDVSRPPPHFHRPSGSSCVHPALAVRRRPDPGAGRDHGDAGAQGRRGAAQGPGRRGRRPRGRHR